MLWNYLQHAMTANEILVFNDGSTNSAFRLLPWGHTPGK